MDSSNVIQNITDLLKEQNKTQKSLTVYLGITQNAFTDWKSGRIKSYNKHLPKIAEFFGVSVDYLLGNTNDRTVVSQGFRGITASNPYTPHEQLLIEAYRSNPDMQRAVDKLLDIAEEGNVTLYSAAASATNRKDALVLKSEDKWKKIQSAPDEGGELL